MDATDGELTAADEFQRLTYGQIGDRLGITADAARQLVRRKGWSRSRPNTIGQPVIVTVPANALADVQPTDYRREPTDNGADFDDADRRSDLAVTLRMALDMLRQQLDRAEQAAAGERSRADALRDRLEAMQAEASEASQQARRAEQTADALRRDLEVAQIAQAEVEADAAELRQADAERRARGRWARLRAAWRGE